MVKNVEETINTNNQMHDMLTKLKIQLEEYKKNRSNFPKDSDGMYILLEGAITVKNNFNSKKLINKDKDGKDLPWDGTSWKIPPIELYPSQTTLDKQNNSDKSKNMVKIPAPDMLDVFGLERFLFVQGYSYYGMVYATTNEKTATKPSSQQTTTCGFIKAEDLSVLPFYDLYRLKEDLEERYKIKCDKLKKNTPIALKEETK